MTFKVILRCAWIEFEPSLTKDIMDPERRKREEGRESKKMKNKGKRGRWEQIAPLSPLPPPTLSLTHMCEVATLLIFHVFYPSSYKEN